MNASLKKILVVGGNGFIGSAVCKAALARGLQVTSVSSSGKPYRTSKGHTPAWASKIDWRKGDALQPNTFADVLPEVDGVVHTLGILIEDTRYKQAVREGDLLALAGSFWSSVVGEQKNPLERTEIDRQEARARNSYEVMNRDTALRVCEAFVSSTPSAAHVQNIPRPFIYVSAEDIFRPVIPARYIETKREAELGIEAIVSGNTGYRGVYIRPSLVYHAHHRPITAPLAALLDLSATLHTKVPPAFPTPSAVLRGLSGLGAQFTLSASPASVPEFQATASAGTRTSPVGFASTLESIANALTIPPIHVDHVAEAICIALDSSRDGNGNAATPLRGVFGVRQMRELIGWQRERQGPS